MTVSRSGTVVTALAILRQSLAPERAKLLHQQLKIDMIASANSAAFTA
jgi:hypothetical protein